MVAPRDVIRRLHRRGVLAALLLGGSAALLTGCGGGADVTTGPAAPASSATSSNGQQKVDSDPASATPSATPTAASSGPTVSSPAPAGTAPESSTPDSAPASASAVAEVPNGPCANLVPADQAATTTGAVPVGAYACDFPAVAPGARVVFLKWADAAGAASYYDDAADRGPRIENFDVFQVGGRDEGDLWTNQVGDQVWSTGRYTAVPYTWQIITATLDQSDQVFDQFMLNPSSRLG